MLEQLAKRDKDWRTFAYSICKDKSLADDLVQDMYIYFSNKNGEYKDSYIKTSIFHLFLQTIKKESVFTSLDNIDVVDKSNPYEYNDKEKELIDSLKWYEKELIELSYEKSFHEIQRELNINYQFVRRILNKTKQKWKDQKSNKG